MKNPSWWKPLYSIDIYDIWYRIDGKKYTYTVPRDNGIILRNKVYDDLNHMLAILPTRMDY